MEDNTEQYSVGFTDFYNHQSDGFVIGVRFHCDSRWHVTIHRGHSNTPAYFNLMQSNPGWLLTIEWSMGW